MPKQFNARAFERELVDAGYMPLNEYVRRWGELDAKESEVLSSRARFSRSELDELVLISRRNSRRHPQLHQRYTGAPKPETNAGSSENNG
jgi:hypothetical protein